MDIHHTSVRLAPWPQRRPGLPGGKGLPGGLPGLGHRPGRGHPHGDPQAHTIAKRHPTEAPERPQTHEASAKMDAQGAGRTAKG